MGLHQSGSLQHIERVLLAILPKLAAEFLFIVAAFERILLGAVQLLGAIEPVQLLAAIQFILFGLVGVERILLFRALLQQPELFDLVKLGVILESIIPGVEPVLIIEFTEFRLQQFEQQQLAFLILLGDQLLFEQSLVLIFQR
jgi:hypothetical protein